eukprot:GEMP01004708.1.p1 GENE.GEMP01004708.1~~GEMP01004708.1.p1  ORF type:complete len:537 (+),score=66.50 GEMP01004708.1:275-1885(+)
MGGKQSCVRKTTLRRNNSGLLERAASAQANFSFRYHLNKDVSADYIILADKVLGTGANGEVLLVKSREEGVDSLFALKRFQRLNDKKECEALVRESEIYLGLDHPHIARLLDVYETKRDISLVMEYCPGGEVFERLKKRGVYKESYAREVAQQMLLAINYLHMKGLAHRDLKLENFMYDADTNDAKIKLIDFGFSCQARYKMSQACGSLSYVAPEVLGQKGYTKQCDMWSFGVICFLLLSGYSPFQSGPREHTMQRIFSGKYIMRADRWLTVSSEGRDFVAALLEVNPDRRLTAVQALAHPWFSKLERNDKEADVDEGVLSSLQSYANNSKFQRMCLNMMSWSLSNKERDAVLTMFKKMDKSNEGWITLSEFKEALNSNFVIKDEEVLRIFKSMDLNNDEHIYYSDFVGAMCTSRVVLREDEIKMTFRKFDKDSSGMISRGNLAEALGSSTTSKEIDDLLKDMDTDRSGDISIEEFISYLSRSADQGSITNIVQGVLETFEGIQDEDRVGVRREKPWLTRKPNTVNSSSAVDEQTE